MFRLRPLLLELPGLLGTGAFVCHCIITEDGPAPRRDGHSPEVVAQAPDRASVSSLARQSGCKAAPALATTLWVGNTNVPREPSLCLALREARS